MFKNIILSLFITFAVSAKSSSLPHITHEDYVHWSDQQREEFHIKIMQMVVDLESQYKHETAKYGYNEERFKKYVDALKAIQSQLFIGSAYAMGPGTSSRAAAATAARQRKTENPSWDDIAKTFSDLTARSKGHGEGNCLFAGWVSQVRPGSGNNPICAHPNFVNGSNVTEENKVYPDAKSGSPCDRKDRNHVQCNPVIFGYKKAADKSLFCVDTNDKAENSSFLCMQQALQVEGDDINTDSREERMKDLTERYKANPSAFTSVFNFNYQTCVCSVPQKNFNRQYQNYMRPGDRDKNKADRYRTCFGLMNMMNETVNNCQLPVEDKSIFQSFSEFLKHKSSLTDTPTGQDGDAWYNEFIRENVKKSPATIGTYNKLCGANIPIPRTPKKYVCQGSCEKKADVVTCSYDVSEEGNASNKLEGAKPEKDPATPEETSVAVKHAELPPQGLLCEIAWKTEPKKEYECSATCQKPAEGTPATAATPAPQVGPDDDVEAATAHAAQAAAAAFNCEYSVHEKGNPENKLTDAKPEKGPENPTIASVLMKHKDLPAEGLECKITWKEPVKPEGPAKDPTITVKLKGDKCDEKTCTAIAETKDDEGLTIVWDFKGVGDLKPSRGWEKPTPATPATPATPTGIASDPKPAETPAVATPAAATPAATTPAAATPAAATPGPVKGPKEITQDRMEKPYKVCGKLVDSANKEVKPGNCVEIAALGKAPEVAAPAKPTGGGGFNPGSSVPQMPQPQIRGSSDTSAVGIR